jgi:DNA-binding beta-propeller fold protein YncE
MIRRLPVVALLLALSNSSLADKAAKFEPVPGFVKLPGSMQLDACSGVAVNSEGEVFLFHRGKQPIICLSPEGKFLRGWGDEYIHTAHGMRIDKDDNVWVTDVGNHQVLKFSRMGELIMALGKAGQAGDGIDEFDKPTDVAFGPDGEFYVSDGYGNSRVLRFTANGGYLGMWGAPGKGPSQFDTPHAIRLDGGGHIVVGDRENDRIQIFDPAGKLLHIWPGFAPFGLAFDQKGNLFVADGRAHQVLQLDGAGKVVSSWGGEGTAAGQFQLPHMLATDAAGNLYVAEVGGKRIQKLRRVE